MPENARTDVTFTVRALLVIAGGMLIHLTLGSFYTFGNASLYIISYLRNRTEYHNLRNIDNVWINTGAAIALPIGISVGGVVDRFLGTRCAIAIGCSIFCAGVAITYFTIKKSLLAVVFTYGFMSTFGNAMAYGPPIQNVVKWLPDRPAFAVGLVVCGFGGGALVFNEVITTFINPDNVSPDLALDGEKYFTTADILDRIPYVFLLLAGIYLTCQIVGILATTPPPGDTERATCSIRFCSRPQQSVLMTEGSPLLDRKDDLTNMHNASKRSIRDGLLQLLKNKNAYLLWLMIFLIDCGMQFALSLYKVYGQTFIDDDHFLALVGSISSLFNALFRPVWGHIMDKFGFQVAMKSLSACFVCLACTLFLTETIGKGAFLIWISGLYASFCGIWSVGPSTLGKLFGVSRIAINMGFLFSAMSTATIAGGFIGMSLQSVLGWHGLFVLSGGFGAVAFFLTFLFNGRDPEGNMF